MRFASCLLILATLCFLPSSALAEIVGFGNFSQFTINQNDAGAAPAISIANQRIQLTNTGAPLQARSIFHNVKQDISGPFEARFTYRANPVEFSSWNNGVTFTIQNDPAGPHALGETWYDLGYGFITKSVALSLELEDVSRSGLYLNGNKGISRGEPIGPVKFDLGNPIEVLISYDGTILTQTLYDTVTSASFTSEYLIDIAKVVGGTTAYVGFTGSTSNATIRDQFISNFVYKVPEPSSLALGLLGTGAVCLAGLRRRRR